jgi:hypothetical protein
MTVHPDGTATLSRDTARALSTAERRAAIGLRLIVVSVVVLQRFAVPGLPTALCMPIVLAIVIYLASERILVQDNLRTRLYLLGAGACCGATLLSASYFMDEWSLKSLVLLVLLYVPFCYRLRPEFRRLYRPLLEFFNKLMVAAACVALAQWLAQILGWTYKDPLALLPRQLLLQTYNTFTPVHYGSSLMKTNAIVFLEPSFCSQFLAIALIAQLILGGRRWRLPLYAAAILTTVSGTGILLVGLGLAVLAVRRGVARALGMLLVVLLLGAAISITPPGQLLISRTTEPETPGSSGNSRFVAPYEQVSAGLARDTATLLFGRGPGQSSPQTSGIQYFNPEGVDANYPVIPKMAAEYGLIATVLFTAFLIIAITKGTPSPTMSAAMLLLHFALSGSLLQPQTVYTAYLFTSVFAAAPAYYENRRLGWLT